MEALLAELDGASKKEKARMLAEAILIHAMKGNGAYLMQLWNRLEGPVVEKQEQVGEITIRIKRDRDPSGESAPRPEIGPGDEA